MFDNRIFEEVTSYKYLETNFHCNLKWNYRNNKGINRGWRACYGPKDSCKSIDFGFGIRRNSSFETLVTLVILYGCKV